MDGDWSDSDASVDGGTSEDEAYLSSFSDTSQETVLCRGSADSDDEPAKTIVALELVCVKLMKIFQDRSRYKLLLGYRDLEAQAVLNLLQCVRPDSDYAFPGSVLTQSTASRFPSSSKHKIEKGARSRDSTTL